MAIQFSYQPSIWISATVNFIVSGRSDLIVGSQIASTFFFESSAFAPVKNDVVTVPLNLNTKISNTNENIVSKVYITGYRAISGNSMDFTASSRGVT